MLLYKTTYKVYIMKLREFRKKKGWTLQELADFLELGSRSTVYNYENGRVPKKDILDRIAEKTNNWVKAQDFY